MTRFLFLLLCWMTVSAHLHADQSAVQLMYFERPPYVHLTDDGRLDGLVGKPVDLALRKAGLIQQVALQTTPAARQLHIMQQSTKPSCGIGWFKTKDRMEWGRFSRPVYTDHPYQLVSQFKPPYTLAGLLENGHNLLAQHGYAYGEPVDSILETHPNQVQRVVATVENMMQMLLFQRADMALMAYEEVDALLRPLPDGWYAGTPEDMAPGQPRHLLCNRAVSDTWLERFNAGLSSKELPGTVTSIPHE